MLTEQEWRKQAEQKYLRRTRSWGAQYVLPRTRRRPIRHSQVFQLCLLLLAGGAAAALPCLFPSVVSETFAELEWQQASSSLQPRQVDEIVYAFPDGTPVTTRTYTRTQLLRGKMLLLDDDHPLPADAPAPNTLSVALQGKGMVPVRNLHIRSGLETTEALTELFGVLQARGVTGLCVWEGTVSRAEQRDRMIRHARQLMRTHTVAAAVQKTLAQLDAPGEGELIQEYAVELRFRSSDADVPQETALESTPQGQELLQAAWRCGFVCTHPDAQERSAFRFRWVGKAHAAAMTYLQLSFEEYLLWLHEKGVLTLLEAGTPKYVIVCQPATGSQTVFTLPAGISYDASLDNTGYAIVVVELA